MSALGHNDCMSASAAPSVNSPARLRAARKRARMTLQASAARLGVSAAHLSRLERGERQPSVGLLVNLADLYNTTVNELLTDGSASDYHLVRHDEPPTLTSADGRYLTVGGFHSSGAVGAVRLHVPPGEGSSEAIRHAGEEYLIVLQGAIEFDLASEIIDLSAGDSIFFDSERPHRLRNSGSVDAVLIILTTPSASEHR